MKRIIPILLLAALSGCSLSAGSTAKKIGSGVRQCCAALGMKTDCPDNAPCPRTSTPVSVVSVSLLDRSGEILTW
ncbi:MAG: hypothetical protein JO301_00005 [Chitinophagaceae bacterium]|nr:hypothetical protein [Chitinophagaceae bacterium]